MAKSLLFPTDTTAKYINNWLKTTFWGENTNMPIKTVHSSVYRLALHAHEKLHAYRLQFLVLYTITYVY